MDRNNIAFLLANMLKLGPNCKQARIHDLKIGWLQ